MDRSLYIMASGMLTELARQDRIANDLANASTPGYKRTVATQHAFGDILLQSRRTGGPVGDVGLGVEEAGSRVDLTQGALRMTDEPLDVALDGDGFFSVATANGVRYTRDGQFRVDAEGKLVTAIGDAVLGTNGKAVVVGTSDKPTIGTDGTVEVGGKASASSRSRRSRTRPRSTAASSRAAPPARRRTRPCARASWSSRTPRLPRRWST